MPSSAAISKVQRVRAAGAADVAELDVRVLPVDLEVVRRELPGADADQRMVEEHMQGREHLRRPPADGAVSLADA